jgi:hypothetical protein
LASSLSGDDQYSSGVTTSNYLKNITRLWTFQTRRLDVSGRVLGIFLDSFDLVSIIYLDNVSVLF